MLAGYAFNQRIGVAFASRWIATIVIDVGMVGVVTTGEVLMPTTEGAE
jgi:hypothetical protein